jgi:hypothetical protein
MNKRLKSVSGLERGEDILSLVLQMSERMQRFEDLLDAAARLLGKVVLSENGPVTRDDIDNFNSAYLDLAAKPGDGPRPS